MIDFDTDNGRLFSIILAVVEQAKMIRIGNLFDMNSARRFCFSFAVACCIFFLWTSSSCAQEKSAVIVRGGNYFDTDSGLFVPNKDILIVDGKFESIGEAASFDGATVLQLAETDFILPGLIDCHAHYNVRLLRKRREEFHVVPIQYLANGVTVTFSCGEYDPEGMLQLRKDIESGKKIGPKLLNSGPYFGIARRPWHADPEQVRAEVDFWAEQGVGGFKAKLIDPKCLEALIEQAHKHGLTVTGHLDSGYNNSVNPSTAIDLGIDRIEHFLGGDAMPATKQAYSSLAGITADMPEFKAIVKKFVDSETVFDCTISAYGYIGTREEFYDYWYDEPSLFTDYVREQIAVNQKKRPRRPSGRFQAIFEAKQTTIDDYFRAGGKISLGTDHFSDGSYLAGFGAHREMHILNNSGIPAADVIRIATINGAKALQIDKEYGSITKGKFGDLMIVKGNPLEDIKNTRNVKKVVRAGTVYDSKELLESVKGKLGPTNDEEAKDW